MTASSREARVGREPAADRDDFALDLADERNWRSLMQHQPIDLD